MKTKRTVIVILLVCIVLSMTCGCVTNKITEFEQDGYVFEVAFMFEDVTCLGFADGFFDKIVVIPTCFERDSEWFLDYINDEAFAFSPIEEVYIISEKFDYDGYGYTIGERAFYACSELKVVKLKNCASMLESAFAYCTSLEEIYFDESSVDIYSDTFLGCNNLKKVSCKGMNGIYQMAFSNCAEGFELTMYEINPPIYSYKNYWEENGVQFEEFAYEESDWNPFEGIEDFKIFVPAEAVEAYKSALGWRLYADHIFPIAE